MENAVPVDPNAWRQPFPYADTEPLPTPAPIPDLPPIVVPDKPVPVPPFPAPTPLPAPAPEPVVPSGLHAALSAIGAWAGSQLVSLVLSWWTKRQVSPPSVGTTGTAIPRPTLPSRKPPI